MLRTIFFWPDANSDFIFSRSAVLSSPSTMRPSIATTSTPSTTRSVIFNATVYPPGVNVFENLKFECLKKASIIVRAGQVVTALLTNQLAPFRLQPLGTNRAITHGVLNGILLPT